MQEKAVRFLREVVDDPDQADQIEAMTSEEYAERKRITIANPRLRRSNMRRPTYNELKERVDELEEENHALNEKLDSIVDIAASEDDEEENDEEGEEQDDD